MSGASSAYTACGSAAESSFPLRARSRVGLKAGLRVRELRGGGNGKLQYGQAVSGSGVTLLIPDLSTLDAAIDGAEALSRALGHEVAEGWNAFPEALQATRDALAEDPGRARWGTRFFVLGSPTVLVGWGGFKGPPADGVVELGYEIAPAFRRRGIASDAVREMLREAFSASEVQAVIAHTLAESGPSTRALLKTGFVYDGELTDEKDGQLWRWRHDRPLH